MFLLIVATVFFAALLLGAMIISISLRRVQSEAEAMAEFTEFMCNIGESDQKSRDGVKKKIRKLRRFSIGIACYTAFATLYVSLLLLYLTSFFSGGVTHLEKWFSLVLTNAPHVIPLVAGGMVFVLASLASLINDLMKTARLRKIALTVDDDFFATPHETPNPRAVVSAVEGSLFLCYTFLLPLWQFTAIVTEKTFHHAHLPSTGLWAALGFIIGRIAVFAIGSELMIETMRPLAKIAGRRRQPGAPPVPIQIKILFGTILGALVLGMTAIFLDAGWFLKPALTVLWAITAVATNAAYFFFRDALSGYARSRPKEVFSGTAKLERS